MRIIISSGHGRHVQGAVGIINEVEEARRVTNRVAYLLEQMGVEVCMFHDDESRNQQENIRRIVGFHNERGRDLDVSIHFNSFHPTSDYVQMAGFRKVHRHMGVEVLYREAQTERPMAEALSAGIAKVAGLKNRGAKQRKNLGFLNQTHAPAVLVEVCFVNSAEDVRHYQGAFEAICISIAETLGGGRMHQELDSGRAIEVLQQAGVIATPSYWVNQVAKGAVAFLPQLLVKMAKWVKKYK